MTKLFSSKNTAPVLNALSNAAEAVKGAFAILRNPSSTPAELDGARASLAGAAAALFGAFTPLGGAIPIFGTAAAASGLISARNQLADAQSQYLQNPSAANRDLVNDKVLGLIASGGQLVASIPGLQSPGMVVYAAATITQELANGSINQAATSYMETIFPSLVQRGLPLFTPSPATRIDEGVEANIAAGRSPEGYVLGLEDIKRTGNLETRTTVRLIDGYYVTTQSVSTGTAQNGTVTQLQERKDADGNIKDVIMFTTNIVDGVRQPTTTFLAKPAAAAAGSAGVLTAAPQAAAPNPPPSPYDFEVSDSPAGVGWRTKIKVATGEVTLIDPAGNAKISGPAGSVLERDPLSGVYKSVRADGTTDYYDPTSNVRVFVRPDGSGYVPSSEDGLIEFAAGALTINANGSFTIALAGSAMLDLFAPGPVRNTLVRDVGSDAVAFGLEADDAGVVLGDVASINGFDLPIDPPFAIEPQDAAAFGFDLPSVLDGDLSAFAEDYLHSVGKAVAAGDFHNIVRSDASDGSGGTRSTVALGGDTFAVARDETGDLLGSQSLTHSANGATQFTQRDDTDQLISRVTDTPALDGSGQPTGTTNRVFETQVKGVLVNVTQTASAGQVAAHTADPATPIDWDTTGVRVGSVTYPAGSFEADAWGATLDAATPVYDAAAIAQADEAAIALLLAQSGAPDVNSPGAQEALEVLVGASGWVGGVGLVGGLGGRTPRERGAACARRLGAFKGSIRYYKNSSKQWRGCWTNGRFGLKKRFNFELKLSNQAQLKELQYFIPCSAGGFAFFVNQMQRHHAMRVGHGGMGIGGAVG